MKTITAYKCEHCNKVYQQKESCRSHEHRCYFNPKTRSCASCAFLVHEMGRVVSKSMVFGYQACLVNVDLSTLKTNCPRYLNKSYREDKDIMNEVLSCYTPDIQLLNAARKQGIDNAKVVNMKDPFK